jgi:Cu(I)/Ag(I) efflux system membrane fusion protein
MHPSVVQDHPGECPICSMTLVPKPEGKTKPSATMKPATTAGTAAGQTPAGGKSEAKPAMAMEPNAKVPGLAPVDLTPDRIQLIGMRTATVKREALGGELRTIGVIGANERGLAQINTRFAGWIQKLLVSETGVQVKRGQVLATIYSPDILRAEQELLVARGWNGAGADGKPGRDGDSFTAGLDTNARRRLELLGISAQEIDEVLRTGKAVEAIAIRGGCRRAAGNDPVRGSRPLAGLGDR